MARPSAALLAALLVVGCGPSAPPPPAPTVLLLTWDTTRRDRLGVYGGTGGLTPRLDELAAAGRVFDAAWAPAPITLPSHATLLTGTLPAVHGVHDNGLQRLPAGATTAAEAFAAAGYRTGAFVGAFVLDARFGLDQGFEVYGTPPLRRLGRPLRGAERRADAVVDEALAWLDGIGPGEPVFAWVHLYDPHFPYAPPEPQRSLHADPYDGEIAFCDGQLGRLLDGLAARGRAGPRLVVMAADHGESFGEHDEPAHGIFLYDTTLRVPLIVSGSGVTPGRSARPVSLADVAPTLLAWAGLPADALPLAEGPSLLEAAEADPGRPLLLESVLPFDTHGWHPLQGLVQAGLKLVRGAGVELYDLGADPGELHDLSAARPELVAGLQRRLDAALSSLPPAPTDAGRALSSRDRELLASLGYTAGARPADPASPALPDPRDRVVDLRLRNEAAWLLFKSRRLLGFDGLLAWSEDPPPAPADARRQQSSELLARAEQDLAVLRERNPADPEVAGLLGLVLTTRERWAEATPLFEQQVLGGSEPAEGHFNLAVCYEHSGHDDWARAEMLKALTLEPRALVATLWIADRHGRRGEWGHAAWWLAELLATVDEHAVDPQAVWEDGPDPAEAALRARVRSAWEQAVAQATRSGQAIAPPPGWPAQDLLPEGVKARRS